MRTQATYLLAPEHPGLQFSRAEGDAERKGNLPELDAARSTARDEDVLKLREVGRDGADLAERGKDIA